ncbi:hypothetical protein PUN28_014353 [Cardiocondyla obscurior]|uniref:Uncharacterized protein n=1 Tax=Cardiocondyla obscurior TaxID=286306 RepID=A0AAW2F3X5_9HYME
MHGASVDRARWYHSGQRYPSRLYFRSTSGYSPIRYSESVASRTMVCLINLPVSRYYLRSYATTFPSRYKELSQAIAITQRNSSLTFISSLYNRHFTVVKSQ